MAAADTGILEALRVQIRDVRNEIVELLARMDHITLQELPRIRADFALKIGCWEQALLEAEIAGRRAKRRLALAQAQANRGEEPQMAAIDERLDEELASWMAKAEQMRIAYEQALSYIAGRAPMGKSDAAELKRLYRTLVKRLHPDVSPARGAEVSELFQLAQSAYRNGDVDMLRSLEVATRHLDPAEDDLEGEDDEAMLEQELELALIERDVMEGRLHDLEDSEEMRLGRLLASPEWVTERTMELRGAVEEWGQVRRECEERLAQLRRCFNGR